MRYAITILAILALASCKKEYKCTCTDKNGRVVNKNTFKGKKKDLENVKELCRSGITSSVDTPFTCTVD